jgi:hypothetical protein
VSTIDDRHSEGAADTRYPRNASDRGSASGFEAGRRSHGQPHRVGAILGDSLNGNIYAGPIAVFKLATYPHRQDQEVPLIFRSRICSRASLSDIVEIKADGSSFPPTIAPPQ